MTLLKYEITGVDHNQNFIDIDYIKAPKILPVEKVLKDEV